MSSEERFEEIKKKANEVKYALEEFRDRVTLANDTIVFEMDGGLAEGVRVTTNEDYEMYDLKFKTGSKIRGHVHQNSNEVIINLVGRCKVTINDRQPIYVEEGNILKILSSDLHEIEFLSDSRQLLIVFPPYIKLEVDGNEFDN